MITPRVTKRPPTVQDLTVDGWIKGLISALDGSRGLRDGLAESINVQVKQNGTVGPRPSLALYGTQPAGLVTGWAEAVRVVDGVSENYLLTTQRPPKAGGGYQNYAFLYYSKDGGPWIKASGFTFETTNNCYFCQADQKVLVTNGASRTNYLDLETMTMKKFTKLSQPTGLTIAKTGLTDGSTILRYGITAQANGTTLPVYFTVQKVNKERQGWERGKEYIKLTWNKVSGAETYGIWVGDQVKKEQHLVNVPDDGSTATTMSYVDSGQIYPNPRQIVPDTDTTEGVIATRAANINGVIYLTGIKDAPWRVLHGGQIRKDIINFSPFVGGWIDINVGSKEFPVAVIGYRTGRGDPAPTVLSKSTNGSGSLKHLIVETQEIAGVPFSYLAVEEANGRDGTDSPDAVVEYMNSIYYPSRGGFKTTGSRPQLQGVLSTDNFSLMIERHVMNLNTKAMERASALAVDGKLLFALPVASYENNEIWVCDLNRDGIWTLPWLIPAKSLLQYNDNSGVSHRLALVDNNIYEFTDEGRSTDGNKPFLTKIKLSKTYFGKSRPWARVLTTVVELLKPEGRFVVTLDGWTESGLKNYKKIVVFLPAQSAIGVGDEFNFPGIEYRQLGEPREIVPEKEETLETIEFDLNEDFKWVQITIQTDGAVSYELSSINIRYVPIGYIQEKGNYAEE